MVTFLIRKRKLLENGLKNEYNLLCRRNNVLIFVRLVNLQVEVTCFRQHWFSYCVATTSCFNMMAFKTKSYTKCVTVKHVCKGRLSTYFWPCIFFFYSLKIWTIFSQMMVPTNVLIDCLYMNYKISPSWKFPFEFLFNFFLFFN